MNLGKQLLPIWAAWWEEVRCVRWMQRSRPSVIFLPLLIAVSSVGSLAWHAITMHFVKNVPGGGAINRSVESKDSIYLVGTM